MIKLSCINYHGTLSYEINLNLVLLILNFKKSDWENRSFWHEVFGCLCCCLEMSVRVLFGHTNSILWVWVWELSTVRARNYKDTRNTYTIKNNKINPILAEKHVSSLGLTTESNPVANSHLCMLRGTFIVPWK